MGSFDQRDPQINFFRPPSRLGDYTHIPVIFGSLIVANLLQSIGTIVNSQWVALGRVSPGTLCSFQGLSVPTSPKYISIDSQLPFQ